jgi:uncharacterized protein YbgA (DUF1722 family)
MKQIYKYLFSRNKKISWINEFKRGKKTVPLLSPSRFYLKSQMALHDKSWINNNSALQIVVHYIRIEPKNSVQQN